MGIVKNVKRVRVDEEKLVDSVESYQGSIMEAYDAFIAGIVEAGKKEGVSRTELLRSTINVLTEHGWNNSDIGVVLVDVKARMDSIHYM